ncbi:TPA: hypothetical protein ACH3X2_005302 [Trebouxia sp. C0005]
MATRREGRDIYAFSAIIIAAQSYGHSSKGKDLLIPDYICAEGYNEFRGIYAQCVILPNNMQTNLLHLLWCPCCPAQAHCELQFVYFAMHLHKCALYIHSEFLQTRQCLGLTIDLALFTSLY